MSTLLFPYAPGTLGSKDKPALFKWYLSRVYLASAMVVLVSYHQSGLNGTLPMLIIQTIVCIQKEMGEGEQQKAGICMHVIMIRNTLPQSIKNKINDP